MKIDGYTPPSTDVGITFVYPTDFGEISITTKMANRDNVPWRLAVENHLKWAERTKNLSSRGNDVESERRIAGIQFDHLVTDWSTTIKSEGKPIEATRENFIELMTSDACRKVWQVFQKDCGDEEHFIVVTEQDAGNSQKSSRTGSNGPRTSSTGSET